MRIALLGPTGYVGSVFKAEIVARGHEVLPTSRSECDIYDPQVLASHLDGVDFLVNCAGYTGKPNVDACETDKANCLAGNAILPGRIAQACRIADIPWGHVSSGCINTGRRDDGQGFTELDAPNFSFRTNNCSFYSGTKALGEEILQGEPNCYIWRLRIPFSGVDSPRNYLSKLIRYDRLLDAENSLSYLPEFVAAGLDCFEKQLPYGIYNLTNPGSVTAREVVDLIKRSTVPGHDKQFDFFEDESTFMQQAAKTPRSNCVLDSSKAVSAGLQLTPVRDAIETALANWQPTSDSPQPVVASNS